MVKNVHSEIFWKSKSYFVQIPILFFTVLTTVSFKSPLSRVIVFKHLNIYFYLQGFYHYLEESLCPSILGGLGPPLWTNQLCRHQSICRLFLKIDLQENFLALICHPSTRKCFHLQTGGLGGGGEEGGARQK